MVSVKKKLCEQGTINYILKAYILYNFRENEKKNKAP